MKARWWTLALICTCTLILLGGLGIFWQNSPVKTDQSTVQFQIDHGESLGLAAGRLEKNQIIRSALLFRIFFQLTSSDTQLPTGTFAVPSGLSVWQAVNFFQNAKPLTARITIPEGWSTRKIAQLLAERKIVSASDFLQATQDPAIRAEFQITSPSLEGFLYPDTYVFPVNCPAKQVIRKLLETFFSKLASIGVTIPRQELYPQVIMASIIEREYRVREEAPLIGSVFWNRLHKGIPLASCATIEYILTEIQGRPHPKRIFFIHTKIPSPYNTYLEKGLPPSPICNPGLTALAAAFRPAQTKYLYFVVNDSSKGSHRFSNTYSEHERARESYLNTFVSKS